MKTIGTQITIFDCYYCKGSKRILVGSESTLLPGGKVKHEQDIWMKCTYCRGEGYMDGTRLKNAIVYNETNLKAVEMIEELRLNKNK